VTRKSFDGVGTEFSHWLRSRTELDSQLGFCASNIDFVWRNYQTKRWMILEEKRFFTFPRFPQTQILDMLDKSIKDEHFMGVHILVFQNTSPEDGRIFFDGVEIDKGELLRILSEVDPPKRHALWSLSKPRVVKNLLEYEPAF
jgi:hypothetical protein